MELVNGGEDYVCVTMQGTGNTANEAALGTLVPRDRQLLVVNNGFYGARLSEIAGGDRRALRRARAADHPAGAARRGRGGARGRSGSISHVAVCHVDTGTGLLNPIEPLAEIAGRRRVGLIVDAIASFGGLPLDAAALGAEAIVLSPNKWLEGLPGIGAGAGQARRARSGRRPLPFLLPRSAPAVAELRGQRPLALHAAGPGDRGAGRGAAPARRRGRAARLERVRAQLALPGRRAAGAGLRRPCCATRSRRR